MRFIIKYLFKNAFKHLLQIHKGNRSDRANTVSIQKHKRRLGNLSSSYCLAWLFLILDTHWWEKKPCVFPPFNFTYTILSAGHKYTTKHVSNLGPHTTTHQRHTSYHRSIQHTHTATSSGTWQRKRRKCAGLFFLRWSFWLFTESWVVSCKFKMWLLKHFVLHLYQPFTEGVNSAVKLSPLFQQR